MSAHYRLPDTRAYPTDPVKNQLLKHAHIIATSSLPAETEQNSQFLQTLITQMLEQNHYTALSVALAMAPNAGIYNVLWQNLVTVLQADEGQQQWLAMPIIIVGGSQEDTSLSAQIPVSAINEVFQNQPWSDSWQNITWAGQLVDSAVLAGIKASNWYAAKQSRQAAEALLSKLPDCPVTISSGQSVQVFYALGFGDQTLQTAMNTPLGNNALVLMQAWQKHFNTPGATVFINPLQPMSPLAAIQAGDHMRVRMACDVFTTNTIRAIRLQNPNVGVVIAAAPQGVILFGFDSADPATRLQPQVFSWPLTPADNMDSIIQNQLDLLMDCQIEHIHILYEPVSSASALPGYMAAQQLSGCNPLLKNLNH